MAEKARTPMSGAEREAKYAAKMKEKDYETWCAKNREKMRKCIESMSEQKRKEMRRRDAERKREKRAAEKLKRNGGEYKTQAALGKARSKVMKALPSDPTGELIKFESCNLMLIILNCSTGPRRWRWAC